jgi:hypothetical protein
MLSAGLQYLRVHAHRKCAFLSSKELTTLFATTSSTRRVRPSVAFPTCLCTQLSIGRLSIKRSLFFTLVRFAVPAFASWSAFCMSSYHPRMNRNILTPLCHPARPSTDQHPPDQIMTLFMVNARRSIASIATHIPLVRALPIIANLYTTANKL